MRGYDQNADLQRDALKAAGCYRVFTDKASGVLDERKQLAKVLDQLRPGDTLAVWRLDRLGRSLRHLVETVTALAERKVGFRPLTENLDTTTTGGKLVFHLFGALAEFERDLIHDRTMAGLTAARARGRVGGLPPSLSADKLVVARQTHTHRQHTMQAIADVVGVSRATPYRHLAKPGASVQPPLKVLRPPRSSKIVEVGRVLSGRFGRVGVLGTRWVLGASKDYGRRSASPDESPLVAFGCGGIAGCRFCRWMRPPVCFAFAIRCGVEG